MSVLSRRAGIENIIENFDSYAVLIVFLSSTMPVHCAAYGCLNKSPPIGVDHTEGLCLFPAYPERPRTRMYVLKKKGFRGSRCSGLQLQVRIGRHENGDLLEVFLQRQDC